MFEVTIEKDGKSYTIKQVKDAQFPFWFENESGEGMGMSEINMFDLLDKAFKENF